MPLSSAAVDRLMRKGGAERVSKAAARKLAAVMEEEAIEISELAVKYAHHAGRKTVKPKDVKRAIRYLVK